MNSLYSHFRNELNGLHRLQWTKTQQLRKAVEGLADCQRRMHRNRVKSPEGHPGAVYVPLFAVESMLRHMATISRLQKDLNKRKARMKVLEEAMYAFPDQS